MKTPGKEARKRFKKQMQKAERERIRETALKKASEAQRAFSEGISSPYPKKLLKGVKWGEFFRAENGDLVLEGVKFSLRIGYFFNIYACAIICGGKYVVLRKVSTKHMDKYWRLEIEKRNIDGILSAGRKDPDLRGDWYIAAGRGISGEVTQLLTAQYRDAYVLERSKFDILSKR